MKTYKLNSEITLTEEQMKEIAEAYNKQEFKYPIFKRNPITGEIIKFTDIQTGTVVWKNTGSYTIGRIREDWIKHTDTDAWVDIPYDKERDLWHGQPVLCWDDSYKAVRHRTFYDAINKCAFTCDGHLCGYSFDNYKPIPSDRYDDWIIEAFKELKDF